MNYRVMAAFYILYPRKRKPAIRASPKGLAVLQYQSYTQFGRRIADS